MTRSVTMLSASLVLGAALSATGAANAAPEAKLNKCWGQITKQFAPLGTHASAHAGNTPTPEALGGDDEPSELGRRGVGNVSKEDHGDPLVNGLGDGAQGKHAIAVAPSSPDFQESLPEECRGTEMP